MADETKFILTVDASGAIVSMKEAGAAVEDFGNKVEKSSKNVADGENKIRTFASAMSTFRRAVLGVEAILGGFGFTELVRKLVDVNVQFERVRMSMLATANSTDAANANFNWLLGVSTKLGVGVDQLGTQFARWAAATKGTNLEGQKTRDIFYEVAAASKVMGLSGIGTSRVMLALTEMISKGVIQSKEAVRQFGQDLPGGLRILAEAAGYTGVQGIEKFREAVKSNTVSVTETLGKLPEVMHERFGKIFDSLAQNSPGQALDTLHASVKNFLYTLGTKSGAMHEFTVMLNQLSYALSDPKNQEMFTNLGKIIADAFRIAGDVIQFVVNHLRGFIAVVSALSAAMLTVGLTGFMKWLVSLAGVNTELAGTALLVEAVTNPILLLAGALAAAVAWLIMFNDKVIQLGNVKATGFDWISSFVKTITDFVSSGPKLDGIFKGLNFDSLVNIFGPVAKTIGGYFVEMAKNIIEAVQEAFNTIKPIVADMVADLADLANPDQQHNPNDFWNNLIDALQLAWNMFGFVLAVAMEFGLLITGTLAPIIEALGSAFMGVWDVIESGVKLIWDGLIAAIETLSLGFIHWHQTGTQATGDNINLMDVLIGAILQTIRIVGVLIEWFGVLIATVFEFGRMIVDTFDVAIQMMLHLLHPDPKGFQDIANDFRNKITNTFQDIGKDWSRAFNDTAKLGDVHGIDHVVSSAVDGAQKFNDAWVGAGNNIAAILHRNVSDPSNFKKDGSAAGEAHAEGFMDAWKKNAAQMSTDRATAEAQRQATIAREQAAWKAEADAAAKIPDITPLDSEKHHKKTPDDKAREAIAKYWDEYQYDNMLSGHYKLAGASTDPGQQKAMEEAAKKLADIYPKKNFATVLQEGTTTLAGQLVQAAMKASLAKQELDRLTASAKEYAKQVQELDSYQEQEFIIQSRGMSPGQRADWLDAAKQLRSQGYTYTVQEVLNGFDKLGNKIPQVVQDMVRMTIATDEEKRKLDALAMAADGLDKIDTFLGRMAQIGPAALSSDADLNRMNATFAVQQQLMDKYKATVFDPSWLNNPMIKSWYDMAIASKLAGESIENVTKKMQAQLDAAKQLNMPANQFEAMKVQRGAAADRQQYQAFDALAKKKYEDSVAQTNSDMGLGIITSAQAQDELQKSLVEYNNMHDMAVAAIQALDAKTQDQMMHLSNDIGDHWKVTFKEFGNQAQDFSKGLDKTFNDALDGMTNALVQFVMTGKLSFADMARAVIQDIAQMIAKWLVWMAIKTAASVLGFADGGVMTDQGSVPLRKYATGGIAKSPQLALFGEGSSPEAYVPLPDGRTIPVTITGGGAAGTMHGAATQVNYVAMTQAISDGITMGFERGWASAPMPQQLSEAPQVTNSGGMGVRNVTVHVETNTTLQGTPGTGGSQSGAPTGGAGGMDKRAMDALSKNISQQVRLQVIDTINSELRPGGVFNPMGTNRGRF